MMMSKIKHYYEMLGDVYYTNMVLKLSLTVVGSAFICSLFVIAYLSAKTPLIISINNGIPNQVGFKKDNDVVSLDEIKSFATEFIQTRYTFTPQNIENSYKASHKFMTTRLAEKLSSKEKEDINYVRQTGILENVYIKNIELTGKDSFKTEGKVLVIVDRIIGMGQARFTSPLKVELEIEKETRSENNLWGLKIINLKEIK